MRIGVLGNSAIETKIFAERFPKKNNELTIHNIYVNIGGSGAVVSATLSRLGFKVYLLSQVGIDENGRKIVESLKKAQVETDYLLHESATTLFFSIFDKVYNRKMFIKNTIWNEKEIISRTNQLMEFIDVLVICPTNINIFESVIYMGRRKRKKLVVSPQSAFFNQKEDLIKKIFIYSDILFLNEFELCTYINSSNYREALNKLDLDDGKILAVTLGKKGCIVKSKNNIENVDSISDKIVDPSGAGDAFLAGFLWSKSLGHDLRKSALAGCISGYLACKIPDLVEKGFHFDDLLRLLKNEKKL